MLGTLPFVEILEPFVHRRLSGSSTSATSDDDVDGDVGGDVGGDDEDDEGGKNWVGGGGGRWVVICN